MWKKVGILLVSLVATISIVYAMEQDIFAGTGGSYIAGGNLTGRIQMAPNGITSDKIGFRKGDRILTGISNPKDGNPMSWQLLLEETYTNYGCTSSGACNQSEIKGFISIAEESIGETYYGLSMADFNGTYADSSKSNIYKNYMVPFNQSINAQNRKIITYRNLQYLKGFLSVNDIGFMNNSYLFAMNWNGAIEGGPTGQNIKNKDLMFEQEYWSQMSANDGGWAQFTNYTIGPNGDGASGGGQAGSAQNSVSTSVIKAVRPCLTLDLSNIVFGISAGTNSEIASVSEYSLDLGDSSSTGYTDIRDAEGTSMKVRLYNSSITAQLNEMKKSDGTVSSRFAENQKGKLSVDTKAGADEFGNPYTVSALVFNENGNFVFYRPLSTAVTGSNDYEFDLTGIQPGKYKVAVVNEAYNDTDFSPKDSSLISNLIDFEVLEGPNIKYVSSYAGSPMVENTYEYSVNVNIDDIIGNLTIEKGANPISLSLESDASAGVEHENDYLNFVLSKSSETSPSVNPISISISNTALDLVNSTNSLKARDYYFIIRAQDANGISKEYPVHITVNKTKPTLSFKETGQKDIKIGEDLTAQQNLTISDDYKDTLTSTDMVYSLDDGVANVLDVNVNSTNPLQYDFNFYPSIVATSLPTTFTLTAKIKETDNYLASDEITRSILVYKELSDIKWTPDKVSYSPSDCTANKVIGNLLAVDGVENFTYGLTTSADAGYETGTNNNLFSVSSTPTAKGTAVEVKTKSDLVTGTYKIQFKVKDSKNKTVNKTANIEVEANAQTGFVWKNQAGGTQITSGVIDITYGTKNQKMVAEGGQSTGGITYELAPQDMQSADLVGTASDYVEINKDSGLITSLKKTGKVKVMATHASDANYSESKIYIDLNITKATQSINFKADASDRVQVGGKKNILAEASLGGGVAGTGIGGITYSCETSFATCDTNTGEVTGVSAGNFVLTATLNKEGTTSYDPNYETKSITKNITVYTGMTFEYADANPKVKANANAIGDSVGIITVNNKFGSSPLTATISTSNDSANEDKAFFADNPVVNGNYVTLKLKKTISADDHVTHLGGIFHVQVIITDGNGPQTYDVTVSIAEADNSVRFTNAEGVTIDALSVGFDDNNNKFKLNSISDGNSTNVTYSAKDTTQDILNVSGTGDVTVLKAGSTTVKVYVGSSNGYGEAEKEMVVTVNPANQSIAFNDTTDPLKVELGGDAKLQSATGNVVLTNGTKKTGVGDITYSSSNPAVVSVDASGNVSAVSLGTEVTLTATINATDSTNYNPNYITKNCTKKVQVFTGKDVSWTESKPYLKAGASIADKKVGEITTQNTTGSITYTVASGEDKEMFTLVNNGRSADVKFKSDASISAGELALHGKQYKLSVNVSDDNGTTPIDITVNIDNADDEITFQKDGVAITTITQKYGVNSNQYQITAIPKSGKAPTYKIVGTTGVINIPDNTNGKATILKAGTTKVEASVTEGNGYAASSKTIDVEIQNGDQWIAFETTNTTQAFVENGTFNAKANLTEISEGNASTRLVTYASTTPEVCTIDPLAQSGTVTMLKAGDCTITAKNSDANWNVATKERTINLYDGLGVDFTQDKTPQAETASAQISSIVGTLKAAGGIAPITYSVSTSSDAGNRDASFFEVNSLTGAVTLKKAIRATDLAGKYDETKKAYVLNVKFMVTDKESNTKEIESKVSITGAPLSDVEIDTGGTGKITKIYVAKDGDFLVSLNNNKGNGVPSFQLKDDADMPQDVVSISTTGTVSILNANEAGKDPVYIEAIIPASGGYDTKTVECVIEVTQAAQPFKFKKAKLDLPLESKINLEVEGILAKGTDGSLLDWSMISTNTGKLTVSGHMVSSKSSEGEVKVKASVKADRNYKAATAEMTINITSKPAYEFEISVPEVTYGDVFDDSNPLTPEIFVDNGVGEKTRVWKSSEPSVATIDEVGNITILKAGEATISCTQSILGQPDVTSSAVLTINKKPITVTLNSASKYVGENMPTFLATIPTSDLVGTDTIGQPTTILCKDGSTSVTADTKAGVYNITGSYASATYPNYQITVASSKLTVKQDASLASWFYLEGATSKKKLDPTKWINEDVKVVIENAVESAGTYDEISFDKTLWGPTQTVNSEGLNNKDVYFRIKDTKALATAQKTSFKIDKTNPVIKSITGTPAKRNALSQVLNSITFGKYFKPKLEVSVKAEDVIPSGVKEISGLKTVHYNVYQIKDDATLSEAIASGDMQTSDTLKLVDEGKYLVCVTAEDNAGNVSTESCSGINIKEIGDDSDEDGIPDLNIDIDNDSKADLNITKNPEDKLPWLNIDTNGDGSADMNIDTNNDGIPELNTGIIMAWKPNKEVYTDGDGKADYKTDSTLKGINNIDSDKDKQPDINIDQNLDGTPELNVDTNQDFTKPEIDIDGDGDGVKDINVDENDDGKPDKNIVVITEWKPEIDVKKDDKIIYDTMSIKYIPKGELEDNGIVIKPSKPGDVFLPNYLLKVNDITKDLDEETKKSIIEITGANSEVKHVFDVSLSDGNNVVQPDGSIIVRIPVDNTIKNPRVLLRNEAGVFEEVTTTIEDGYFVFETNYLGQVSIVGDKDEVVDPSDPKDPTPSPDPDPTPDPTTPEVPDTNDKAPTVTPDSDSKAPTTSVKGTYTSGTGGAITGDNTDIINVISLLLVTGVILGKMSYTKHKKSTS